MSAPGSAPRATLELRVRVWGMGANDQPFFQNATAQNVSSTGAWSRRRHRGSLGKGHTHQSLGL